MQESGASYTLETGRASLSKGGEANIVYAIPNDLRDPSTCIIIAHGAGGPMHSPFIRYFHTELAKNGYVAVKFNFPYMEARRKVPDRTDVLERCYRTVIEDVRATHRTSRIFIGGKSMGGRIASQVAAKDGVDVNALFFLGYPLHPPGRTEQLRDKHLYSISKPMLFISGTRDNFATKDLLERVVAKIGPNAQLDWIENGDHSFKTRDSTGSEGTNKALTILLEWLAGLDSKL